jgi:hypothetical protein
MYHNVAFFTTIGIPVSKGGIKITLIDQRLTCKYLGSVCENTAVCESSYISFQFS